MDIDPNVTNVILGVVANALTSLIAGSFRRMKAVVDDDAPEIDEGLRKEVREAFESVAEKSECDPPPRMEELSLFITSPEVEAVVRQLYAARLFDQKQKTINQIREEFQRLFAYTFGLLPENSNSKAEGVFRNIVHAVDAAMDTAVRHGVLPAHEAKSVARFKVLHDELLAVKKNLEFLNSKTIDIQKIRQFEKQYRNQIADRHGRITPPNFDDARKLPIDSIYVVPKFTLHATATAKARIFYDEAFKHTMGTSQAVLEHAVTWFRDQHQFRRSTLDTARIKLDSLFFEHEPSFLTLPVVLSKVYRTVILGNPGGGKSTLTNKICYDFSKRVLSTKQREGTITAVPLVLREYGNEKKLHNYSILQFIEATARDKYQVNPPEGAVEYLLLNGRVAIVFDGLDELLETGYRQEIRDDIESFCNLYPSVPVIITSREVGYEQAPLDRKKFEVFRLAPFDEDQVSEYVRKWFETRSEYTTAQKEQKARDFLQESQIVSDLRSNPLMLGLMCNIYRGENYIPKNRPDVYRKCAEMLFERWDRSREIPVIFHFEDDIRPAMAYLAHWIYSNAKLQEGVTEQSLIAKAADYLLEYRYENRDRAERAAREFIEFCRGRAWVFTETGTDKNGDGLYQFTHRTFLEYFAAVYLVRTHETTEELIQTLLPRLRKREWDIVGQLAFQIKNRSSEGAKDKLLSALLNPDSRVSVQEEWGLLSFMARCLEFMEPSPKVTRDITDSFIQKSLTLASNLQRASGEKKHTLISTSGALSQEVFQALGTASDQNRETISESIKARIVKAINEGREQEALNASEIGLHLDRAVEVKDVRDESRQRIKRDWSGLSDSIVIATREKIIELTSKNFTLAHEAYKRQLISIDNLIDVFGVGALFQKTEPTLFRTFQEISIANSLIGKLLPSMYSREPSFSDEKVAEDVRRVGQGILLSSSPVVPFQKLDFSAPSPALFDARNYDEKRVSSNEPPDCELLFGAFSIFAVWIEAFEALVLRAKKKARRGTEKRDVQIYYEVGLTGMFDLTSHEEASTVAAIANHVSNSGLPIINALRPILSSRIDRENSEVSVLDLNTYPFTSQQLTVIQAWKNKEISLVKVV